MIDTYKSTLIVLVLVLSGCSSTHIHLHASELPRDKKISILEGLKEKGFKVHIRTNTPPSRENLILYFPHKNIQQDLWAIDDVLATHNISAEHRHIVHKDKVGKHEYTAGNIGVYLLPTSNIEHNTNAPPIRKKFPITETDAEFISTSCDTRYVLELLDDGHALISDFNLPAGEATLGEGSWQSNNQSVQLTINGETFIYQKEQHHQKGTNYANEKTINYHITLEADDYYRIPFSCSFQSTFSEVY